MPEIIDEGTTGFIVDNVDEAVEAVRRLGNVDRAVCRQVFEQRFSARSMGLSYLEAYKRVLHRSYNSAITMENNLVHAAQNGAG